jgi:hypothetical protein
MKYIEFRDNKVINIHDNEPKHILYGSVARCDYIPPLNIGEYHEVFNVQEHTETYIEQEPREVKKVDEETKEEYIDTEYIDVEKTRIYKTCELAVKVDEKSLKRIQLRKLKTWFNNEYRYYNEKLTRFAALNMAETVTDKIFGMIYLNLNDLYIQAEKIRAEINDLEEELKNK